MKKLDNVKFWQIIYCHIHIRLSYAFSLPEPKTDRYGNRKTSKIFPVDFEHIQQSLEFKTEVEDSHKECASKKKKKIFGFRFCKL